MIPPEVSVHEEVLVEGSPADAFRLFTDGISTWWPLEEGYSFGGDRTVGIVLEPREGGRLYERFVDGDTFEVGQVLACSPPDRIVFTWKDPTWRGATEVEVLFRADDGGTRVAVEHRGFERLGADGEPAARRYGGGWPRVLRALADEASSPGN